MVQNMEVKRKSLLFVINTMGMGGGENALLELLRRIDPEEYEISLFVLTGQGELLTRLPSGVKLLNKKYYPVSVLNHEGKIRLFLTAAKMICRHAAVVRRAGYMIKNLNEMIKRGRVQKDKLLWKVLADGAQRFDQEYDLAVAYLEGGAAYYVASHVKAKKKAVFVHINYKFAGYTRALDEDCYLNFDRVFAVSENVKDAFLSVYPECSGYTDVFYNLIDKEAVLRRSREKGGFCDHYSGFRILTTGRLVPQKAVNMAIDAMKILKESGGSFRWYVLGEGELRKKLEEQIRELELEDDFFLLGTRDNPFPYYAQCDLYVHTSYFEGRSIAIEEAQILGCAVLATEHNGVREQIEDGVDGKVCRPSAEALADQILYLSKNPKIREAYGCAASEKQRSDGKREMDKLMKWIMDI